MATEKPAYEPTTAFGKRNPYLAAIVPDAIENAVDALLPDAFEAVLDRRCERVYYKYQRFRTDMLEGIGEVAGVLFRVAKHAYEKFHIHDLVFGVYHLALHHATVDAVDAVEGSPVHDQALIHYLIQATDAAAAAYCPTRQELCDAAGIDDHHLLLLEPVATTTRPAYALWVDAPNKRLVWGFRGTTDLNDMLTDACASCVPYDGGYAHWGMLQAAQWFAANELPRVKGFLDQHPGYDLLLVGHSLGAGTAAMLAHLIKNNAEARKALEGVKIQAVGVATPAVLTEALAAGCSDYITSVVLMHDVVPRFSIHNVFAMKEEMDATQWGDILADTLKDWAVPDVIEHSATYQRLAASSKHHACTMRGAAVRWWLGMSSWAVGMLHFYGILKPNPDAQQGAKGAAAGMEAAAATPEAARPALADAQAVAGAVAGVQDSLANVAQEDVHQVFAPGRLFFIKRLDKYKGRAKYGNNTHRCVLCEDEASIPTPHCEHDHAAAATPTPDSEAAATAAGAAAAADAKIAAGTIGPAAATAAAAADQSGKQAGAETVQEFYPGAEFELIEAAPQQRFKRIVLRETCLMDHLCGGYVQGLSYALSKVQGK